MVAFPEDEPTLWVMRHGERVDKVENSRWHITASPAELADPGLTPHGRWQAQRSGDRLRHEGVQYIYSSPFLRAVQTAVEVASVLGLLVRIHPSLGECLLQSMFHDQPSIRSADELAKLFPGRIDVTNSVDIPLARWPESEASAERRCNEAVDTILGKHPRGTTLVVTHLFAVKCIAVHVAKEKPKGDRDHCCMTKLCNREGRWRMPVQCDTSHLSAEWPSLCSHNNSILNSFNFDGSRSLESVDHSEANAFATPKPDDQPYRQKKKTKKKGPQEMLHRTNREIRLLRQRLEDAERLRETLLKSIEGSREVAQEGHAVDGYKERRTRDIHLLNAELLGCDNSNVKPHHTSATPDPGSRPDFERRLVAPLNYSSAMMSSCSGIAANRTASPEPSHRNDTYSPPPRGVLDLTKDTLATPQPPHYTAVTPGTNERFTGPSPPSSAARSLRHFIEPHHADTPPEAARVTCSIRLPIRKVDPCAAHNTLSAQRCLTSVDPLTSFAMQREAGSPRVAATTTPRKVIRGKLFERGSTPSAVAAIVSADNNSRQPLSNTTNINRSPRTPEPFGALQTT